MAKRDINRRETKKPKKGEKKPIAIGELEIAPVVEVVRKHRKTEDNEAT
ncbi:MAG: hypothetical protein JW846_08995 [Dehalococcoidia bacterium]|nr:hypothetical protein [Dehalococcoidia bacterium]